MSVGGKREAQLTVVAGRKGVGKTFETTQELKDYCHFLRRKVLILDINNEYTEFRPIICDEKNIKLFTAQNTIEIRRVLPTLKSKAKDLGELKSDMSVMLENFRGGLIVFDDINRVVGDAIGSDLIGHIVTQRHKSCDIILQFQGIGRCGHPKILMNTNLLRLHWTDDSVHRNRNKFVDKEEILKIAEAIVNNKVQTGQYLRKQYEIKNPDYLKNPQKLKEYENIFNKYCRFFLWVNYDSQTISGKFTKDEMIDGVFRYISENSQDVLTPELNRINRDGKRANKTPKEAIDFLENKLVDLYWGNK